MSKSRKEKKSFLHSFLTDETKRHSLIRFLGLIFILVSYFIFISLKYGTKQGFFVTVLTWSFFVLCTPIVDAGFLLAFPIRLLLGVRMVYTQIVAYFIAILLNTYTLTFYPSIYNKTLILKLFYLILTQPYPYWGIIILSAVGTFLSIIFGDELIDVSSFKQRKTYNKHVNKYQLIAFLFLFFFTIILYKFLIQQLGMNIPI